MNRFLSLDGGGDKGIIQWECLVKLESVTGKLCREIFQFVWGTSVGALGAAAVAAGLPATQILSILVNRSDEIFNHPPEVAWPLALDPERGYMFESSNIEKVLKSEFAAAADWTLDDCPIKIMMTAKHVNRHQWYFVKSGPKNSGVTGNCSLIQCACASAAAPVYFSPFYVNPGSRVIGWCYDGGVGTTGNPVLQGCKEAFLYDDYNPAETLVVSMGTGWSPDPQVNAPTGLLSTIEWTIGASTDAPLDDQTENAMLLWPGVIQRLNWRIPSMGFAGGQFDRTVIPQCIEAGKKAAAEIDWKSILKL